MYDYKTANWQAFKFSTAEPSAHLPSCDPEPSVIDQRAILLGQILPSARDSSVSLKGESKGTKNLSPPLIHLIKIKRKLRREFMKTRSLEIKQRVNHIQTQTQKAIRKERDKTFNKFYTDLNNDLNPKTFWQKINQLNGKKTIQE